MKFKDLKLGMKFDIVDEDNPAKIYTGKITDLWLKGDSVNVQFDDEVGSFTWGNAEQLIHNFMIYRGE